MRVFFPLTSYCVSYGVCPVITKICKKCKNGVDTDILTSVWCMEITIYIYTNC